MNLDDFMKKYKIEKLNSPEFAAKQDAMMTAMLDRLNLNLDDKDFYVNEVKISKLALIVQFEKFIHQVGTFCLLSQIPMAEAFEVLRAYLDYQELRVQEAKKHIDNK